MTKREKRIRKRFIVAAVIFGLWFSAALFRIGDLQFRQVDYYKAKAQAQHEMVTRMQARRGSITDRHGELLAASRKAKTVCVYPGAMEDAYTAAQKLIPILGLDRQTILKRCRSKSYLVYLKRMVSPDTAATVEKLNIEGINFHAENKRFYPEGPLACHVLGFSNKDNQGCYGLEKKYQGYIAGTDSHWFSRRDAHGNRYRPDTPPSTEGFNLVLALDEVVQFYAERALDRAMAVTRSKAGTVVIMDCWNGDVLAMANRPSFDPNRYGKFEMEWMKNRAVSHPYEPGSTFKLVTFAAALEAGVLDLAEKIYCGEGKIRSGKGFIRDHKSFKMLTPPEILAKSSNVGTILVGRRAGKQKLYQKILDFGFGELTGIDLPDEEHGTVHPPNSWSGRTADTIAFGQEVSLTPLQLCRAVAAIASDGFLRKPRMVLRIERRNGDLVHQNRSRTAGSVVSTETAATLRQLMAGVVQNGTAKEAASIRYAVAGKTGTAQKIVNKKYATDLHVASFAGFAPLDNPAIAVVVVLDEPKGARYHGGQVAAPVFREVVDSTLRYLGVPSMADEVLLVRAGKPARMAGYEVSGIDEG